MFTVGMRAAMMNLVLLECMVVAIYAEHVFDSGQYFKKLSDDKGTIPSDSALLNEDFFKCQQSSSCADAKRQAKKTEIWEKLSAEHYTNLARGTVTDQSSTTNGKNSTLAVDGSMLGEEVGLCSVTGKGIGQWWMADFRTKAYIKSVSITPKLGCCSDRLQNFDIRIGDTKNAKANDICRKSANITVEEAVKFNCNQGLVGRYLYIITNIDKRLSLCEVEAYGFYV